MKQSFGVYLLKIMIKGFLPVFPFQYFRDLSHEAKEEGLMSKCYNTSDRSELTKKRSVWSLGARRALVRAGIGA